MEPVGKGGDGQGVDKIAWLQRQHAARLFVTFGRVGDGFRGRHSAYDVA